jgi:hypothetical protein
MVEQKRGRRRTRSTRSLTDLFGADSQGSRPTKASSSIVRQESFKEAKRKKSALDDWAEAEAELAAIERDLTSTRAAIEAMRSLRLGQEPQPEPQPQPEPETDSDLTGGELLLTGRPASTVTAAREQLLALRRHHEWCRRLLAAPLVAPSPARSTLPATQRVAADEVAQRRRRAELTRVEALVASIESGQVSPEDLVGVGPSEEDVMRDIIPIAVPRKR